MTTTVDARRTHPDDPGEPPHGRGRVGIAPDEEGILSALAAGRAVLEIGTGLGYSTRALARTAIDLTTVDIDAWVHRAIVPPLRQALPAVEFRTSWPHALLQWEVIFIDADHSAEAVCRDVIEAWDRLTPWGLVVVHDYLRDPAVQAGVGATGLHPIAVLGTTYGIALLLKEP